MQPPKKIKKQKKAEGVWTATNYNKLTQLHTRDIIQGLFLQLLKLPSKIEGLISLSEKASTAQFLVFICDEINGSDFEDILRTSQNQKVKELLSEHHIVRCRTGTGKTGGKENVWDDFLDIQIVDGEVSDCESSVSSKDVANSEIAKITKELKARVFKDEELAELKPFKVDHGLFELFAKAEVTEEERERLAYPAMKEDYVNSAEFDQDNQQKYEILGLDCEMVRTERGIELAQVVLIDSEFRVLLNRFVKPTAPITDYLTAFSGISPKTYENKPYCLLTDIHKELRRFVGSATILVGHGLENDLHALKIMHKRCVDTSILFKRQKNYRMSLKNIAYELLGLKIQQGAHNPAEDARVSLALARLKLEGLDKYLPMMNYQQNFSVDVANRLQIALGLVFVDFEYNLKRLRQSSAKYELVLRSEDAPKMIIKQLKDSLAKEDVRRLVCGRLLLNKNHDYQRKIESLMAFLEELRGFKDENEVGICISTVCYRKADKKETFEYDLMLIL